MVHFGNGESLNMESDILHTNNKGHQSESITKQEAQTNYPVSNIIDRTCKETGITRPSGLPDISKGMEEQEACVQSPEGFASKFIEVIKEQSSQSCANKHKI